MSRSPSGNVLLRDGDGVLGTHRVFCRRERPSSGAQLCALEEADGWRYQLFATNSGRGQPDFLEARYRSHARVEDRILLRGFWTLSHDVARTG